MHPLVRDLYKRVLIVGKDYPGARLSCAHSLCRRPFPAFSVLCQHTFFDTQALFLARFAGANASVAGGKRDHHIQHMLLSRQCYFRSLS